MTPRTGLWLAGDTDGLARGCRIEGWGEAEGAGVRFDVLATPRPTTAAFVEVVFAGNAASKLGGGLALYGSAVVQLRGCVFQGNRAEEDGAAIYVSGERGRGTRTSKRWTASSRATPPARTAARST